MMSQDAPDAKPTPPDWTTRSTLSVEEAGAILGLSKDSAYKAVARGEIPALRLGRRLRVPTEQLRRLLAGDLA